MPGAEENRALNPYSFFLVHIIFCYFSVKNDFQGVPSCLSGTPWVVPMVKICGLRYLVLTAQSHRFEASST